MKQDIYLDVEITVEKVADKNTLVSMLKQAEKIWNMIMPVLWAELLIIISWQ